jgi:hypothetical protein
MVALAGIEQGTSIPVQELFNSRGLFAADLRLMGVQVFPSLIQFSKGTFSQIGPKSAGGEIGFDEVRRIELRNVNGETTLVAEGKETRHSVNLTGTEASLASDGGIIVNFPSNSRSITLTTEKRHRGHELVLWRTTVSDVTS